MIFIGIDPGIDGGIGIIYPDSSYKTRHMPVLADKRIDSRALYSMIDNINKLVTYTMSRKVCFIEQPIAMPKQSSKGTLSTGIGYGKIISVIELLNVSYQEIAPNKWKKEFSLLKKSKRESIALAQKLFPLETFTTEKGRLLDGEAEALLIAEYARRTYNK